MFQSKLASDQYNTTGCRVRRKRARCFQRIPVSFLHFHVVLDRDISVSRGRLGKGQNARDDKVRYSANK